MLRKSIIVVLVAVMSLSCLAEVVQAQKTKNKDVSVDYLAER